MITHMYVSSPVCNKLIFCDKISVLAKSIKKPLIIFMIIILDVKARHAYIF